jgi:hypothetical protein
VHSRFASAGGWESWTLAHEPLANREAWILHWPGTHIPHACFL